MSHHNTPEARIGQAMGILMAVTQDPEAPYVIRALVGPHVDGLVAITEVLDQLDTGALPSRINPEMRERLLIHADGLRRNGRNSLAEGLERLLAVGE